MKTYKNFSEYKTSLLTALDKVQASELDDFISLLLKTRDNSKNIFIAGNGGSAAIASHFVVDLLKIPEVNKKSFSAISLCDNSSVNLAFANDESFDVIFRNHLERVAKPGDIFICISSSGNSINLIKAVEYCLARNIFTLSLTGFDGGKLKKISKHSVHVNTEIQDYAIAEDSHSALLHYAVTKIRLITD